jgi:hypothetical protein
MDIVQDLPWSLAFIEEAVIGKGLIKGFHLYGKEKK